MAPLPSMLNLPNTLSVIRIVLVPLLVVVMLTPPRSWDWTGSGTSTMRMTDRVLGRFSIDGSGAIVPAAGPGGLCAIIPC